MKNIFLFIFALTLTLGCQDNEFTNKDVKGNDSIYSNPVAPISLADTDTVLELKVKLIDKLDTLRKFAYCGVFDVQIVLRFELIKVIRGPYTKKEIRINIHCPQENIENKWLKNNKPYTYRLRRAYSTTFEIEKGAMKTPQDFYEII